MASSATRSTNPVRRRSTRAAVAVLLVALTGCAPANGPRSAEPQPSPETTVAPQASPSPTPVDIRPPDRVAGIASNTDLSPSGDPLGRWAAQSRAERVEIISTVDASRQEALWAPPPEPDSPLIVHVHSWSSGYEQEIGLPVAWWADSVGWGFLQPDFRGTNDNPDATGSTLTTQDVVDAIDFAVDDADIDPDRVYVTGFSGGGMMSLLLAGRHADRFAGAASWVPVYDLVSWYEYNRDFQPGRDYVAQIEASCSGDPTTAPAAREECIDRSPASVMDAIRDEEVPVYLGGGITDDVVPVVDVLRAFNALADSPDRISEGDLGAVTSDGLPAGLVDDPAVDTRFTPDDPAVLFSRQSASATVVIFDGAHEFVYYPGLDWLSRLDASLHDSG